jgi:type I restriction enzyme S subunit
MEVLLKEICEMKSGGTPKKSNSLFYGGKIPWVTISDFKNSVNDVIFETDQYLTEDGLNEINKRIFPKGTLLLAMYGSVGKTAILGVEASTNQAILGIQAKDNNILNINYLKFWLEHNQEFLSSQSKGAILKNISLSVVERQKIDLPEIETQNRIVAILEKVKYIMFKREKTIVKYNELLRAIFLDTFGNPMERPNQWKLDAISKNSINLSSGTSYSGEENKLLDDDELGVLKVSAVTKGFFNANEFKAVKKDIIKRQIINPKKGDLLFSRANTLELVGATCIVDADYNNLFLPDKIWKVETDEAILKKTYLHYVLQNRDVRKTFLSIATGSSGSMLNISMDKFRNIIIPYPPIELQEQFEKTYLKYTGLKAILKKSHQYISDLFGSISQLAFKGELDFNTAVDLEMLLENDYTFFKENSNQETIRLLLKRLDKNELNDNKFYDQRLYDKAKKFVFELLKEDRIKQIFDEKSKSIKLTI